VLRVIFILYLVFLNLEANRCDGWYKGCQEKLIDSKTIKNNALYIPIKKHQRLVFSKTPPHAKILKKDRFLPLYLIEDKEGFDYPFSINNKSVLNLIAIDNKRAIKGKIVKKQKGHKKLATFSEALSYPSILVGDGCMLEGIVTTEGIIQKDYIEKFLKTKKSSYVGVGTSTKVKKSSKTLNLKPKTKNKERDRYKSGNYLELIGIIFDKNFNIVKIKKEAQKYQLKIGDKLLQVNQKDIINNKDILKTISKTNKESHLLFQRDNFQFFIRVN